MRYGKTWSALHAIRGFRMQSNPKGNRLPFATAPKVILALLVNCQRAMEHRMQYTFVFVDFFGFSGSSWYPFAFCKKELNTFWSRNKRGQVNLSNKVTRVFSFASYANQPILYHESRSMKNEEKFWKKQRKLYLFELEPRQQFASGSCELRAKQIMFSNTAGIT